MGVRDEIVNYIQQEDMSGALLLTGKWGSGKSYIVKDIAKDINDSGRMAIAIISLFGIDSVSGLQHRVQESYADFKLGTFGRKTRKTIEKVRKVINGSLDLAATAADGNIAVKSISKGVSHFTSLDWSSFFTVSNTINNGQKEIPFVLIFDDFERCSIKISDRLGAINECVENLRIKVIIVADEDKIEDSSYKEFKEKLVFRTAKINDVEDSIVCSIVEGYKTKNIEYKQFLLDNKNIIISVFKQSKYDNLRSLKACICDFERIFIEWCKAKATMEDLPDCLYKFCAIEFETKKGNYVNRGLLSYGINVPLELPKDISDKTKQERIDAENRKITEKYGSETFSSVFISIKRWIVDGIWDAEAFATELQSIYNAAIEEHRELSHLEKLLVCDFWDLQQEDIDEGLPELVLRTYEGSASFDDVIKLIRFIGVMKKYSIPLPCEVDYNNVMQGVKKHFDLIISGKILDEKQHSFVENEEIEPEAVRINKFIKETPMRFAIWKNRERLIDYLRGDPSVSSFEFNNKIFIEFDDEMLALFIKKYTTANNRERIELARLVKDVSFVDNYYSDESNVQKSIGNYQQLIDFIERDIVDSKDSISLSISRLLKSELQNKVLYLEKRTLYEDE